MGYETHYFGEITIDPPLNDAEIEFINSNILEPTWEDDPLFPCHGWCDWSAQATTLSIDEVSRSDETESWLTVIIANLLAPTARTWIESHIERFPILAQFTCDHTLNGTVYANGENSDDLWSIKVTDNNVRVDEATILYGIEHNDGALAAINHILNRPTMTDPRLLALADLLKADPHTP